MADSKWIDGLKPEMPVVEAARLVLTERLAAVGRRLYWALNQGEEDIEHVHQLRVSTRRAGAALVIFADCLPGKQFKRARRQLRELRRAAGRARDWDVFLENTTARLHKAPDSQRPGLDFLLGLGHGQRMAAQDHLIQATHNAEIELAELKDEILAGLIMPASHVLPLADLAQSMLTRVLEDLVRAAEQDVHVYEHLHHIRILGKQLRYAMEIFVCCFPDDFRTRDYAAVEQMQEMLGQANDSYVASRHLDALRRRLKKTEAGEWSALRPGIEAVIHAHQRRLTRQRRLFAQWWKKWHLASAGSALSGMLK